MLRCLLVSIALVAWGCAASTPVIEIDAGRRPGPLPGPDSGPLPDGGPVTDLPDGNVPCSCACGSYSSTTPPEGCAAHCARRCPDGGPPAGACVPLATDVVCFDRITAGVPTTVRLLAGDGTECACGQELSCEVTITGDHELAIHSGACPAIAVCDACEPFVEGTCELPPLTEGTWHVRLPGRERDAMDLVVVAPDAIDERDDVCIRTALPWCAALWEPEPLVATRVCAPTAVPEGERTTIQVADTCTRDCEQIGPCEVDVVGDAIHVRPIQLPLSCEIGCPDVCRLLSQFCVTPPLAAGTYRIVVEGTPGIESTIVVGEDRPEQVCVGE